ncbi:MAG: DUF3854 domain-containing protein [Ardenticatenaceae bacterium]|nr:DUF3854 domain-containing protein [Ardenticatenaceae bacterium]
MTLSEKHLTMLRDGSGIGDAVVAARGYRTITDEADLVKLGFDLRQCRVPGLLLPLHTTDGTLGPAIYRPDNPRVVENRRKKLDDGTHPQQVIKYEQPKGEPVRVDCPPVCQPQLVDPKVTLFITEGQKKADALATLGACAIALTGVWNWKQRNKYGGTVFTNDLDYIAWENRPVYLVFDSDVLTKHGVRQALTRFTDHLKRKGAVVHHVYLPQLEDGKTGVDDWLVATGKGIDDLIALSQGPRPEPKAAPPKVELLDEAPARLVRPLSIIGGYSYAATWCYVKILQSETQKKDGTIVRHDPPLQRFEKRLFILRNDGVTFGDGAQQPLDNLPLEVYLPEVPIADRLLSASGMKAYDPKNPPQATAVFQQVKEVVNRFIDFDHSLAEQDTMAELLACFILATWFLDAFTVTGYLWPNGDRGSGKTQLLQVVTELSYLGHVVHASGSFAALRDLADYGATLAFDDAEDLADPRSTSPDKRTLLLAGTRRGTTIPFKEKDADQNWGTRHVNPFSFRLFSAIHLPDHVLASRTIIVPLTRTPDRYRANVDPLEYGQWPHDRRWLIDNLWCMGLHYLPVLRVYEGMVNQEARLTGRSLEPWRAILAVARWLDDEGVAGLWHRMESLSWQYQEERPQMETDDFTTLALRALLQLCANCARCARCASHLAYADKAHWLFTARELVDLVYELAAEEMMLTLDKQTTVKIGMTLRKMRLKKPPRSGGKGSRHWLVTLAELKRWAVAYGLPLPEQLVD